jgi:glutamyl-tRNA reductase
MKFLNERAAGALDQATLRRDLFMLSGEDAVWHLLRVSAGLDSLVVGEGQILAQVKKSHEHGVEGAAPAGKVISRMLNTAVTAGKRARAETGISKGAVSISSAAAEFTATRLKEDCKISTGMKDAEIAIIGAGKMSRLLLVHLESQGVNKVTVINRSFERIDELQAEFPNIQITKKLMSDMWEVLKTADVVYPSTSSETTIIDPEPLVQCMKQRTRAGGLHIVDISVPRNVHADCAQVSNVFSYNVDDLKTVVQKNTAKRRREMIEAENILREELGKFRHWQHSLGAIPTIAKLQEKAENLRKEEMAKAVKKLAALSPKDLETVEKITKGIVAKLLHGPMCHLRQQHEGDATRAAISQVQKAFQLEH